MLNSVLIISKYLNPYDTNLIQIPIFLCGFETDLLENKIKVIISWDNFISNGIPFYKHYYIYLHNIFIHVLFQKDIFGNFSENIISDSFVSIEQFEPIDIQSENFKLIEYIKPNVPDYLTTGKYQFIQNIDLINIKLIKI